MRVQELSIQEPAWLERRVCRGEREMLGELGCAGWLVGSKNAKGQTPRASLPATRSLMIFFFNRRVETDLRLQKQAGTELGVREACTVLER